MSDEQEYGLTKITEMAEFEAPDLSYLPPVPKTYAPKIALIGAGGITEYHLKAYRRMGLDVVAICDVQEQRARDRQQQYYPQAKVFTDYQDVLAIPDIEVVDVATHPDARVPILFHAIDQQKHILSQKPFVTDLKTGNELVAAAQKANVQLAVNQNGRWANHFSYMAKAVQAGLIGALATIDFVLHWDHTWTEGTQFEEIHHLILYDFAIHWFDIACAIVGDQRPNSVFAQVCRSSFQTIKPPFLGHVVVQFDTVQVRMCFNAHVQFGQEDRTVIAGSKGTLRAVGPDLNHQKVELHTSNGIARPALAGNWFDNGFEGTMGELLCAIEENRTPWNNARENLRSLEICFGALKSADSGKPTLFE